MNTQMKLSKLHLVAALIVSLNSLYVTAKEINLVTTNWEPYFFEDGLEQGVVCDIAAQALKLSGYTLKMTFTSWARGYKGAMVGKYNGMLGAYYTEERAKHFDFPDPIMPVVESLFVLKERKDIKYSSIKDLKGLQVGIMINASHGKEFDAATNFTKVPAADYERSMTRLLSGSIDAFAGGHFAILYMANKKFPDDVKRLKALEPPLFSPQLYVMFRKSDHSQEYVKAFNDGLKALKASGAFDKIKMKHNM